MPRHSQGSVCDLARSLPKDKPGQPPELRGSRAHRRGGDPYVAVTFRRPHRQHLAVLPDTAQLVTEGPTDAQRSGH